MDSKAPLKGSVISVVYAVILIVSIIIMLYGIRFSVREGHEEVKEIVAININHMQSSFTKVAEAALKEAGEQIVRLKAEKVARDIENYLISHPGATIIDLQKDASFKSLAIQSVGKTGYTAVHESATSVNRFHVNPKIVDTNLGVLAIPLPDFWKIIVESRGRRESGGYYRWHEADGSVREKYMWVSMVSRPTADGVTLSVAATTYIDEFLQPLAQLSGELSQESDAASEKVGSLSESTLNKTLAAIVMIILIFCGVVGYMAFRLMRGYHRIELEVKEREKIEAALRRSEHRLGELIDFLPDATFAIDAEKRVTVWNNAMEEMTGVPAEQMIGRGDYEYTVPFYGERRPQLMDLFWEPDAEIKKKYSYVIKEGGSLTAEVFCPALHGGAGAYIFAKATPLRDPDGNLIGAIEAVRDITERKRMEDEIRMLAVTDSLTGLYNRRGFLTLSEQQLKIAERTGSKLLLLFADLDGMKWINDSLGHVKGDEALMGVAGILKKVFREADIIARVGGDEFAVLALGISAEYPEILKDRLQQQIDLYNHHEKRDYHLSLSIGIAESDPKSNVSIDDMMARADERMYENKRGKTTTRRSVTTGDSPSDH